MKQKLLLRYFTPIAASLIVSITFVSLFQVSGMGASINLNGEIFKQVIMTLGFSLFGLIGVTVLYWLMRRSRDFEIRVIIALVVAPTSAILVIVVSQTILMVVAKTVSTFMTSIVVLISLYVAVFSVIFMISNAFSSRVKNFIFVLYGSLIGAFVSLLLPTVPLIVMLVSVALYDLIILNIDWFRRDLLASMGSKRKSSRPSYIDDNVEVGMGELIFYSFLPAHVQAYYGYGLFYLTLLMVGLGIIFNLWMLQKREIVAGLPAPIILGISPLILHLLL